MRLERIGAFGARLGRIFVAVRALEYAGLMVWILQMMLPQLVQRIL